MLSIICELIPGCASTNRNADCVVAASASRVLRNPSSASLGPAPSAAAQSRYACASPVSAASNRWRWSRSCPLFAAPWSVGKPCAAYASIISYPPSIASARRESSSRAASGDILPTIRVVVLEVFTARDLAEQHRLGDPQLL